MNRMNTEILSISNSRSKRASWHQNDLVGLHFDLHATSNDEIIGEGISYDILYSHFNKLNPDWVSCDAKGHPGYTSYPSKLGCAAPGLKKDMLGIFREVTDDLGIKLCSHISGTFDKLAIEQRPDWARMDPCGNLDKNQTCNRKGYTEELLIPQMLEIIENYHIDGFWVDGDNWATGLCWCETCQQVFKDEFGLEVPQKSGDLGWDRWLAFHRQSFVEHVRKYTDAVHVANPDCIVCSNWMYSSRQPEAVTVGVDYLSGDFDPAWGADRAAVEGRVFDNRNMLWDMMCWIWAKPQSGAGQYASDVEMPYAVKPAVHLKQEAAEVISLGGAITFYDIHKKDGGITEWHADVLKEVVDFVRLRKDYCKNTSTTSEVGILHLTEHQYADTTSVYNIFDNDRSQSLDGALHAMLELGLSADIILKDKIDDMGKYKLVVLPEHAQIDQSTLSYLEVYVSGGGLLWVTGTCLSDICPDFLGIADSGTLIQKKAVGETCYLPVNEGSVPVCRKWKAVKPNEGTQVWVNYLSERLPKKDNTNQAVATFKKHGSGGVIAVHGDIFYNYYKGHYPMLREFIASIVERLNIDWKVKLSAPPWLEMILREKEDALLINLINRGCSETLSPNRLFVTAVPCTDNITLDINLNNKPKEIELLPEDRGFTADYKNGRLNVVIKSIDIHSVLKIVY